MKKLTHLHTKENGGEMIEVIVINGIPYSYDKETGETLVLK